ncbi:endospore germination permease [Petroclostridium sp. X23]|nr:endospore germination permease [Petroclostridium sp. X23]WHH61619.1 endospore germination permease [Petroclostridium sp. X23]
MQIMTLTASTILSVRLLMISQELAVIAKQDAWISVFLGGLLASFIGLLIYFMYRLYPGKDLPEVFIEIGGNFFGRIMLIPLMIYVLSLPGITVRIFAELMKIFLLDRTPDIAVIIFIVLVVCSVVKRDIYSIAGLIDILFPIMIVMLMSIILLSIQQVDMSRIKPILFRNTDNVLKGVLPGYSVYIGYAVISYILRYSIEQKGTLKWYLVGLGIPVLLTTVITFVTMAAFGPLTTEKMMYPVASLAKSIEFPVTLLERLEVLIIVAWISVVFTSVVMYCFMSVRNFTVMFGIQPKHQKYVAYAHIPMLVIISLASSNVLETIRFQKYIEQLEMTAAFGFTPILFIVTLIKKRKVLRKWKKY